MASSAPVKTSISHPLRIDFVAVPTGGVIGMTLCPGKTQPHGMTGNWRRDLSRDLDDIKNWGATTLVTLMETDELRRYGVSDIGAEAMARGLAWHHLAIVDQGIPDQGFEALWVEAGRQLRARLAAGERIVLHCLGGLGRTGTLAARLLVECGATEAGAIASIRKSRPGTIETPAQERYVHTFPAC